MGRFADVMRVRRPANDNNINELSGEKRGMKIVCWRLFISHHITPKVHSY
jgi:hypothetical protein